MPMDLRLAYASLIIFSAMGTGWVLEAKRWGVLLELLRGVSVAGALLAGIWFSPVSTTFQILAAAGLALMLILYAMMWKESLATSTAAEPAAAN